MLMEEQERLSIFGKLRHEPQPTKLKNKMIGKAASSKSRRRGLQEIPLLQKQTKNSNKPSVCHYVNGA